MAQIRRLDRENLTTCYGIEGERLLPWQVLNAPFEGAWCVLRPGGESTPHAHHEYEIFIVMTGRSTLIVDGEPQEIAAGDIVHLVPGSTHQVVNDGAEDLEYYSIWWDTDMSVRFVARHDEECR